MNQKPKFKGKLAVCLILAGVLLMGYALLEIEKTPALLQYIVPADAETQSNNTEGEPPPTQLRLRMDALEEQSAQLSEAVVVHTLTGTAPMTSLTADQAGASAGLIGMGENHFLVYPALLHLGRFPQPEELELGERVMLVDEQVALALFKMIDIIDREVEFMGETYRIIGVLRHQKKVGDEADQFIYVPLATLAKRTDSGLETLRLTAVPVPKGGAMVAFKEFASQWMPGGQAYDLRREKVGNNLWARFLGCGIGFALLGWLISKYVQSIVLLQQDMQRKLVKSYITKLMPYLVTQIVLRMIALAVLAGLAAALALLLLEPIKVFPEYVPDILVEPKMIAETFWSIRRTESSALVLRSPQVIRLLYFGQLCNIATIVTLAGGCLTFWKLRRS